MKHPPANAGNVRQGFDSWVGKIPWRREKEASRRAPRLFAPAWKGGLLRWKEPQEEIGSEGRGTLGLGFGHTEFEMPVRHGGDFLSRVGASP